MLKTIANRYAKRAAARRRAIRRKAAAWKQRARRAFTLMLVAGGMMGSAGVAHAQMGGMGQAAMAPTGGLVNRAVTRLQDLEANGPGWLYYGLNAADRGLGYNGSYMTLGGYIPYAEDDLGGLWAADLRGHFSEYGGFFSNVGAVRKQFIGGTLLGVGVYWDYDGDQNQYELRNMPCGTETFGQFGHSYNQVGVSAEWLTDYGNLRSNGYIPVGTTAYTAGAPGSPFYQNYVMAQYGLDAALSGADLEVGAYVPGLSDWAGMISVGGYALGNERYDWYSGTKANQDVVPWFGGVYTRLDMTFARNWDFSLQANNDSYFDWTGFARLTYRMGGSRRRNVPDQMEQPMMRNEHIVRAHQTPIVATNPETGTPWRVIHVNNAAVAGGTGAAESPFTTLAAGNAAATNAWDIVFVDAGTGAAYDSAVGLNTTFTPLAANQYLIGNGLPYFLPTECSGPINLATRSGVRPLLTNPTGPSIEVTNGLVVNNFTITGSQVGILGTGSLSSGINRPGEPPYGSANGAAVVNNVDINGTQVAGQTGVFLDNTTGDIVFKSTKITDMTNGGFKVDGGDPNVTFSGQITSNTATNGGFVSPIVAIENTSGGVINLAVGTAPAGSAFPNAISDTGGAGVQIVNNTGGTINIGNATLTDTVPTAINVENSDAIINVTDSSIVKNTAGAAINVDGASPVFAYEGKITNTQGNMLHVNGTLGGSVTLISPPGSPFNDTGDGILVENSAGDVTVVGATINSNQEGILVENSSGNNTFNDVTISGATTAGVSLQNNTGVESFNNLSVTTTNATGILATNNSQINVTGNSQVTSTGAPALKVQNSIATPVDLNLNFTGLTSTNSTSNGVFVDNATGSLDATNVTVTSAQATGVVIANSDNLAVNFINTSVSTAAVAGANGIEVNNTNATGGAVNLGKIAVTTAQGTGLQVVNSGNTAGPVSVVGGTIAATGGPAISANGSVVDITLTSAQSTNSTANGINLIQSEGAVRIDQTTVNSPTGVGINLENNVPGFLADFGVTTVSAPGAEAVRIVNATPPSPDTVTSFDSLAVTSASGAAGILTRNGGVVNFDSPATVTTNGGPAVDLENTVGTTNGVAGSGWTFNQLSSTNSTSNGIRLVNLNSDFQVLNGTTINGAAGTSILIADNEVAPLDYSIGFNTVSIVNRLSTALAVDGIAGQVVIQNLQVNNASGVAGDAVRVFNTSSRGAGGRVYIESGSITGTQGNGIIAQDSILRVAGTTIAGSSASAVFATALANQTTTIEILDSALTTSGINGIRLEASGSALGSGTINATANLNQIDVTGSSMNALVLNTFGVINLDATSNFGTGGTAPAPGAGAITLDNSFAGFLGISQSSIPQLQVSNNGAAVTPLGVINFNVAVPTPPPPSP